MRLSLVPGFALATAAIAPAVADNDIDKTTYFQRSVGPWAMHGKIEGGSLVDVTAGSIEFDGDIADRSTVLFTATGAGIHIRKNIEGGSHVVLRAAGPIVIDGKVDGHDPRTRILWCAPSIDVKDGLHGDVVPERTSDCTL